MTNSRSLALCALLPLTLLAACGGNESRKVRYVERGQEFLAAGNLDKARVEFSNALQIDPNDAKARYYAGQIAEKQVKPRDAVANYQAALEADPQMIAARSALGRLYLLGGLPDKAREVIAPGLTAAPEDAQLRTVRGGLRALEGDLAGAMEDAEAAVKAAPDDEVALAFLAAQHARQKHQAEAIAVLQKGLERLPDSVDLRVILAEMLYQTDRKAEALEQLRMVARQHKEQIAHWQRLAQLQLLEKDTDGAIESLREAVTANPDSIEAKTALVTLIGSHRTVPEALAEMQKFADAEPKRADLKIALAQFQEAANDQPKAEATYRAVIKSEALETQGLVARNRLAAMLVRRNDIPAAETLLAEVLKENPRDNDALILRAGIEMSRNETAAAITDLRAVLRDQPTSVPLMRALANAHLQDGDAALAEEALRQAVQANPLDPQSRFDLASLLTASGRGKQALPVLEQLIKDAPDNVQAREAYFRVQTTLGDFEGARATATELKTLRPDLPTGSLLLGALHEHDRKLDDAAREYDAALRLSNDPTAALTALVRVELARKQPAKAIERVQLVIDRAPRLAPARNLLGEIHLAGGNFQAAIKAFDDTIAQQPAWWVPYRGKMLAQLRAKQAEQAVVTLGQGIEKTGALELYGDLAVVHEQQGRFDAAISTYEDALKRHPRSVEVANNLAMMLVSHRTDKASLDRAAQVAQLLTGAEQPAMLDTLGWVKYHHGALGEALPLLQKAAERAPKSPAIRYHLGMAQLRSGDHAAAKLSLESALAGNAKFTGAEDARTALANLGNAG
jgi:tetratricopeptide (TPR) repeat protein